jgi:hypothetical protein
MKNKRSILGILAIFMLIFVMNGVYALEQCEDQGLIWSVSNPTASPSEVKAGGSVNVALSITNGAQNTEYTCTMSVGSKTTSKLVNPQATEQLSLTLTAPTYAVTSQKTESVNVNVECEGIWDKIWPLSDCVVSGDVVKSTSYKWPTQADILELQAKTAADSAKTSASNAISSANSNINTAKNRINEASRIGADVSSATTYLNSAESSYTSANNLLSSGNSAYNTKDYSSAKSYYNQAQSKAESAQSSAANAKSTVDKIIEDYNKAKTDAQNKVSDANSAIDTAKQRIDASDKIIEDATVIGLDTAQAKADVATARTKIDTAEDYYSEASNMFSAGNFESAKSKAQSAINLADDAEDLATKAYNSLHERVTVAGESSKAILNANSEISQMNEILTKMDYIISSTSKWGVDLSETQTVVNTAKTNVDSAEDLLSQAKNRQASGTFDSAVTSANEARDKAASSRNRLDTMTQGISSSIQEALDKALAGLESKIIQAEAELSSAQNTYGATPELIVNAENDLSEAKKTLQQVKNEIQTVKSASGLMPLLENADATFKTIDATEAKIVSSIENSKGAKMGLTQKVAIGGAIVAGAVGGGFLYYRKRKNKKSNKKDTKDDKKESKKDKKESKKEEKEETQKEEKKKKITNCPKCNHKIKKENFCPECGEKIER